MKRLSLRAIVFDFDGTLAKLNIDFLRMRQAVMELITPYDISVIDNGLMDLHVLEMIDAATELVSRLQPGKEPEFHAMAHERIVHIEVEAAREGALLDGTREMLQTLQTAAMVKTGVITRNCLSAVQMVFPDIHQYMHAIITREQTPHVKPHPEHLLTMLKMLGVSTGQAAMVGDHPLDMKIGRGAGVYTIGVLTGNSRREELTQAGAHIILNAATDIPALLL